MKKIDLLKSVSLFWDLEEKELGYISDKMVSKNFDNGNLIFLEESEGENLFFVVLLYLINHVSSKHYASLLWINLDFYFVIFYA